jgi:2-polyprenyl-3-methyl-5-hydroxy-6-metoxy-1,4-benzoquinol methylase
MLFLIDVDIKQKNKKLKKQELNKKNNEKLVNLLYEKYPYPNRNIKSIKELKKYSYWITKLLGEKNNFWKRKKVLELGCGTGQFTNSIALHGAQITGIDFSEASLKIAKETSNKFNTKAKFKRKNILEYNIKKNKNDIIIALGSLHHTIDAKKGFIIASKNLKKNGIIIIGLYNKYGRFRHQIKRLILKIFCGNDIEKRISFGEKYFKGNKNKAWLADKYGQVHESYHSVNEILDWFKEENIRYITSSPKINMPFFDEIKWFFKKKGAFFVMIGKKT